MTAFFDYMHFGLVLIGASLWCFGFHVIVKNFMRDVFNFYIDSTIDWGRLQKWQQALLKPIFACPYCMASIHGTCIFFIMLFGAYDLYWWPVFCVSLCGLNYVINSLLPEYE